MNLLILSDLHLDCGDRFGTFGWKPKKFIRQIEKLIEQYSIDSVVLNGDVFDLYKYTFKQVYKANFELISYFKRNGFIFLRGNHDILNPFAKDSHIISNSKGKTIYIEHGHNADFMNGTRLGRAIELLGFYILKKTIHYSFIQKFYFRVVEYDDEVNRIPKKYNSYRYLKYALKLLRNYDVVILGHTHKLESHKTYYLNNKKIYMNSGTCSLGRLQALVLNTETLEFEMIKVNKREGAKKEEQKDNKPKYKLSISA